MTEYMTDEMERKWNELLSLYEVDGELHLESFVKSLEEVLGRRGFDFIGLVIGKRGDKTILQTGSAYLRNDDENIVLMVLGILDWFKYKLVGVL